MKKRGKAKRPRKTSQIHIRCTDAEKQWLESAWLSTNFDSFSAWAIYLMRQDAERLIGPQPKR